MPEIHKIILISLFVSFIVLFANKTEIRYKLRDFFDQSDIKVLADLLDCDFCLCFWISVVASIAFFTFSNDYTWLLTPVFSTPLSRYIL